MMDERGSNVASLQAFLKANTDFKVYDFSSLEKADQCLRKYKYRYVDHVAEEASLEAEFSKHLIHPMVAECYQRNYDRAMEWLAEPSIWQAPWKNFQAATAHMPHNSKQQRMLTLDSAKACIAGLVHNYPSEPEIYEYLGTEQLYWRVLPALKNAVWVAKPDLTLRNRRDNDLTAGEIKVSTWDIGANMSSFDRQLLSQAWTMDAKHQIKLFFHLAIDVKGQPRPQVLHWQTRPDAELLVEWLDETQFSVGVIQDAQASGIWPKRAPRSCNDFNKPCQFLEICPLGSSRDILVSTLPKSNPFEYLGLEVV